ncbi:hypothetical protein JTB14_027458 [Gonioctena quinquepunctata]|nr:hypothetical protein JTB14_027458 [Gonioctena quinquepunctata]
MMSTFSFPSKHDVVKMKTYDFLEGERMGYEKNSGNESCKESDISRTHEEPQLEEKSIQDHDSSRSTRAEKSKTAEVSIIMDSSTDFSGSAPKRYITKCFIQPKTVPYWYTESVFLNIGSTRRKYQEKIFFKEKFIPVRWSERMSTEVTTFPKNIISELDILVDDVFIELAATA